MSARRKLHYGHRLIVAEVDGTLFAQVDMVAQLGSARVGALRDLQDQFRAEGLTTSYQRTKEPVAVAPMTPSAWRLTQLIGCSWGDPQSGVA